MSTPTMTPEQAYTELHNKLHAPVFFNKLAQDYGLVPQSEQEALDLLTLGGQLHQAYESDQLQKHANTNDGEYANYLNELTGGQAKTAADEKLRKAAATSVAQDPHLANCILTLQHAAATRQSQK